MIESAVILGLSIGALLFVTYNTTAVYHYALMLPDSWTKIEEYRASIYKNISYMDYLRLHLFPQGWINEFVFCPYCVGAWISGLVSILAGVPMLWLASYSIAMLSYMILKRLDEHA